MNNYIYIYIYICKGSYLSVHVYPYLLCIIMQVLLFSDFFVKKYLKSKTPAPVTDATADKEKKS